MYPRQAVVLVGGLGSRLGELTRATPKPMLDVGGRPFVEHVIAHLTRFGFTDIILLAGFRGDVVRDRYDGRRLHGAALSVVVEPEPLGTGGGLKLIADRLAPWFLMSNGDTFFDADLLPLLRSVDDNPAVTLVLREVSDARRYGRVDRAACGRVIAFREKASAPTAEPGFVNGGTYRMHRDRVLDRIRSAPCSFEQDVLPALVTDGAVRSIVGSGYFIDIGILESLVEARTDLISHRTRPAGFFDRDGVLNVDHGYTHRLDDLVLTEGAADAIRLLNEGRTYVIVVSNQAGIARGHYDEAALHAFNAALRQRLMEQGARIDAFYHCPHHPAGALPHLSIECTCRKPAAGMLEQAARDWPIDRARSFLVGDTDTDLAAAAAFGIPSVKYPGGDLVAAVEKASQKVNREMLPAN